MIKLGPHSLYELGDTVEWSKLKPSVVKLCWDFSPLPYMPADVMVLGRPEENFIGNHPVGEGDPVSLGAEFAETIYAPLIRSFPRVDIWEGPNEVNPDDLYQMQWYARFLAEFARQVRAMGRRAAIGSFATGTPRMELWPAYTPALQACRDSGSILSRHSYGPLDEWHSYRHRLDEIEFRKLGHTNSPLIISECGEDAPNPPWRKKYGNNINAYYSQWIKPFVMTCNQDPYVIGATLFTVGDGHATQWHDFDMSGTGLIDLLRNDKDIQMPDVLNTYTHVVTATALNVRQFPWLGTVTPPIVRQIRQGDRVQAYALVREWALISPNGNEWVSGFYLRPV